MSGTRLVLVRHGEAQTHLDRVIGGHRGCTGLSEQGRRQAEALRDRLVRTGELGDATAFYASVLPRAIETAEIIAPGVGDGGLVLETSCDLCEQHPGDADSLTWEEASRQFGGGRPWSHWTSDANGESRAAFQLRVGEALHRLVERHEGETVVIVCHGGVIRSSYTALAPVAPEMWTRMSNTNTGMTEWLRTEALPTDVFNAQAGEWLLVRHNDAAHLR